MLVIEVLFHQLLQIGQLLGSQRVLVIEVLFQLLQIGQGGAEVLFQSLQIGQGGADSSTFLMAVRFKRTQRFRFSNAGLQVLPELGATG